MMTIAIPDERLTWQGHISMEEKAGGLRPWKIDYTQYDLHHAALQQRVGFPTGMRLSFRTNMARLLGRRGLRAMEKLMGMVMTVISVQMVMTGLKEFFGG